MYSAIKLLPQRTASVVDSWSFVVG